MVYAATGLNIGKIRLSEIRQCRMICMYTFVETKLFSRAIGAYLTDDEFAAVQMFIAINPDAGPIIKGSGGVRKLRWAKSGKGKRGGIRIIYYALPDHGEIWLLTVYSKAVRDSIPASILRAIKEQLDETR